MLAASDGNRLKEVERVFKLRLEKVTQTIEVKKAELQECYDTQKALKITLTSKLAAEEIDSTIENRTIEERTGSLIDGMGN